jgi:plastocyanin
MRTRSLGTALLALGLCTGCNSNSSTNPADMSTAAVDMAVVIVNPLDMTMRPPDMAQTPDMAGDFHGCDDGSFMDRSAAGASRTVMFGGGLGTIYSPKCILIAQGQMVTFSGDFSMHSLRAGTTTNQNAGTPGNPITATMSGTSASFTFNSVGTFPFICLNHGAMGMGGVVRVR